jgi:branched-chain amino acid transport system permease protein
MARREPHVNLTEFATNFPSLTISGLSTGAVYALIALGYTLVYGVLKLINFAHSEVFMIGTFAAIMVWAGLGFDNTTGRPTVGVALMLIVVGILVAAATSGGVAMLVEVTAYRPLRHRNAPPLAFLISAIGASFVLAELVGALTLRAPRGAPLLLPVDPIIDIGPWKVTPVQLSTIVTALVMMVALDQFVAKTRFGRGIRSVAQDPNAAALMGVNKGRVILLVFLLGGMMAGVAAVFNNMQVGLTTFSIGFLFGLKAFSAAVLGGIGNLRGALLGGLILGLVENYSAQLWGTHWRDLIGFLVLIGLLVFRPTGLLGEALGRTRV